LPLAALRQIRRREAQEQTGYRLVLTLRDIGAQILARYAASPCRNNERDHICINKTMASEWYYVDAV
jgi:hypothetical protein